MSLIDDARGVLDQFAADTSGETQAALVRARDRLDEPLRVAIAGRLKAGKSTLLNAIIGVPLAASDATECTRHVTWYRHGSHPLAFAVDHLGERTPLAFRPGEGIDISSVDTDHLSRLEVEYPSPALNSLILVDTPGIASPSEEVARRTTDFLIPETSDQGADVVIYLLRYLHEADSDFLEAFTDPTARYDDPVRSIAVLSRADELGGGRGDWLAIARAVADEHRRRPELRRHASDVLPVSALIGLEAEQLSQRDVDHLRAISRLPVEHQDRLLLSVDRFCRQELSCCDTDSRAELVARFGMTGVRHALALLRHDDTLAPAVLIERLVDSSGIVPLRRLLLDRYEGRAAVLKAGRALALARALARDGRAGRRLERELDRITSNSHELAELGHLRVAAQARSTGRPRIRPDLLDTVETSLGIRGTRLQDRVISAQPDGDLVTQAEQQITDLRVAGSSAAMRREATLLVQAAIRSLEHALAATDAAGP